MIERYNIVKRIKTSSGIIGNGHPGSWQPLRGRMMLLDNSVVNSSIRYKLVDEEPLRRSLFCSVIFHPANCNK